MMRTRLLALFLGLSLIVGFVGVTAAQTRYAPPTLAVADQGLFRITLQVTDGPHKGQTFTFQGHDTFLVGRSKRAHLRLPAKDMFFSRVHFLSRRSRVGPT